MGDLDLPAILTCWCALPKITGCGFEKVWRTRIRTELGGVPVNMIGKQEYIKNKRASGRARDLADLDALS